MPVAEALGRPGGRVLLGDGGAELARFAEAERDGRRVAEVFRLTAGVAPQRVVPIVMAELAGWRIHADEPFGRLLVAAGATAGRHAHVMSRDLVRDPTSREWLEPPLPAGMRLTAVDRPAVDLAGACRAAYPREHPDFNHEPAPEPSVLELELEGLISGTMLGPLLRCSCLAVAEDGAVLGAALVNGTAGEPPLGGPWIAQLFRHPQARGAGSALLRRALAIARRDGLPAVGLAVTHGNPAFAIYKAHGFIEVVESFNVEL